MSEELLEVLVSSEVTGEFLPWFWQFFKDSEQICTIEEFSIFFLNFVRSQTDGFLKGNSSSSASNTPRKLPAGGCQNVEYNSSGQLELQQQQQQHSSSLPLVSHAISFGANESTTTTTSPNFAVTSNLLPTGNDHATGSNCNNSSMELLDDSLRWRSTPTAQKEVNASGSYYRKSLSRTFDSIHDVSGQGPNSPLLVDSSSPLKTLENRMYRSDTSTPIRKANRSDCDVNTTSYAGCLNKARSFEKSNISPKSPLCLGDFMVATPMRQKRRPNKEHVGAENRSFSEPSGGGGSSSSSKLSTKPKRRVVPTLVSSTTNSFTSPAFRSENNILRITKEEEPFDVQPIILEERRVLKARRNVIAKEFTNELSLPQTLHMIMQEKMTTITTKPTPKRKSSKVHADYLSKLTHKHLLDRFVLIHSALIDLSLVGNILTELAFAINLINIDEVSHAGQQQSNPAASSSSTVVTTHSIDTDNQIDPVLINRTSTNDRDIYSLLRNGDNCTYYAHGLLRQQKSNLILLDVITLKVILDNERLETYDNDLRDYLDTVCAHKVRLESIKSNHEVAFRIRQDFNNVFYQQENDTRNNFPTEREFTAFKQQRDMFYGILKTWESKHLDPTWKFSTGLGSKVYALVAFQENPINMAHLAKLFISQLIISSSFTHSPNELEISLPNIDLDKLTKLQQRLVQPSFFSTDYQFPGNQAFFRDFLLACRKSLLFIEQLKIALAAQLIEMNDSSYEILNLSSKDSLGREYNEYVVRPETLSTMRILSKFLGLVETLPFTYEGSRNSLVDNRQIELRNMIQPSFDVMAILRKSITERKLIITIPWIVQYISMLDYVTLRLAYYRRCLQLLYELYMNLTTSVQYSIELLQMRPTSIFIIRTSLGWLFDNPMLPEDYYKYRQNRRFLFDFTNCDVKEMTNIFDLSSTSHSPNHQQQKQQHQGLPSSSATVLSTTHPQSHLTAPIRLPDDCTFAFDPLLEHILYVACPFLADFRVSIMPTKFSKSLSRTGRYRHITTKIFETPSELLTDMEPGRASDAQTKLSEAFLHSQSLSVRKIVEFVIERTTSAVIKDFQIEFLLPSKTNAMNEIAKIDSTELKEVSTKMRDIFKKAHQKAMHLWDEKTPTMIEIRVKKALDALLPIETLDAIKNTCTALVIQKCKTKTDDWRQSNLKGLDFYSKDLTIDAEKQIRAIVAAKQQISTILRLRIDRPTPSQLFDRLQYILHFSQFEPLRLGTEEIIEFLAELRVCLNEQQLPTSMNRLAGVMTINLVQNLIRNCCDIVTDSLINSFIDIWTCVTLREFVDSISCEKNDATEDAHKIDYLFNSLLPKFYIRLLGNKLNSFDCLTRLLVALVKANLVTIDYLNEQFVALLKFEWPHDVNRIISNMLDRVARETLTLVTDDKSQLFMEMLADLTRDLNEF